MSPSKSRSELGWRPERRQTYLAALEIDKTAPGTVCTAESHYQDGRHPIPYREGYCHHYREPNEHYHASLPELRKCER